MTTMDYILNEGDNYLAGEASLWVDTCEPYIFFDARRAMDVITAFAEWDSVADRLTTGVCGIVLRLGDRVFTEAEIDAMVNYIIRTVDDVEHTYIFVRRLSEANKTALLNKASEAYDTNALMETRNNVQQRLHDNDPDWPN